jgi:hypothetical protein
MSDRLTYPIRSIADICEIPEAALPRFYAELPAIVRTIKQIRAGAQTMAPAIKAAAPWPWRLLPVGFFEAAIRNQAMTNGQWVDDTLGQVNVSVMTKRGAPAFYDRSEDLS